MIQTDYTNIEQFTPEQLEPLLLNSLGFYAREDFTLKLAAISREIFDTELRYLVVFLLSRQRLYDKVRQIIPQMRSQRRSLLKRNLLRNSLIEVQSDKIQPVEVIDIEQEDRIEDAKWRLAAENSRGKRREPGSPCCNNNQVHTGWRRLFSREDFEQLERGRRSLQRRLILQLVHL